MNNSYRFILPGTNQTISIPIELKWDLIGRDESVDEYQKKVLTDVIGVPDDFEILRFAHENYTIGSILNLPTIFTTERSVLEYDIYFYSGNPNSVTSSTINNWVNDYNVEGFNDYELYYKSKPFIKSFYKLDFYDSPITTDQTISFTIILPTINSKTKKTNINFYLQNVDVNIPSYRLDYLNNNEGFFIYWLRSREFINLDKFYMSAKFFDAKEGVFVKLMTTPQSNLPNKFIFNNEQYFYIKVELDYDTKTYAFFDFIGQRIGTTSNPIKWYEYVNP